MEGGIEGRGREEGEEGGKEGRTGKGRSGREEEKEGGSSEHNHLTCRNKLRSTTSESDPNTRMERLSSLYCENILAKQQSTSLFRRTKSTVMSGIGFLRSDYCYAVSNFCKHVMNGINYISRGKIS